MTANGSGQGIRVFDESGKMIGMTYPKRAKGLVRNGRARWIDPLSNTYDPVNQPDSIVLYRTMSGTDMQSTQDALPMNQEDKMNDNINNNDMNNQTDNERRIQEMIEKFQAEMAKARQIAEKAAADAQAAMEAAKSQSRAAGEACACDDPESDSADTQKTVGKTLKELGGKLEDACEAVAGDIRDAAAEIAGNENVRETVDRAKSASEAVLSDAKKKLLEAEERLEEARRAYEEAERTAAEAEESAEEEAADECADLSKQVKENMKELAEEAGDALKTAWTELKKGWRELSSASAESFEWLRDNTKDARESVKGAFREFGENVRQMMNDVGDAGENGDLDGEDITDETGCCCSCGDDCTWGDECTCAENDTECPCFEEEDTADEGAEETIVTETVDVIRSDASDTVRESIEEEIESVKTRVNDLLGMVKEQYDAGAISFEQYVAYTDKYTDYLHTRLTELRDELRKQK